MKLLLTVLLAGGALASAHAADPPAAKPKAKTKVERAFGGAGKGPLLTRAELRACLAQQEQVRNETDALSKERAAREAEKNELQASGEALKVELAGLDRTDIDAVDRYNAKAQARDAAIDAFQAGSAAYNEKVRALDERRQSFAQACGSRRYDEDDEIAIRNGR
jgi:hypothetical protein